MQAFPGSGGVAFRLTQPGSYYLNSNVVVTNGDDGIEIAGDNIDLDLNGYSVIGQGGATGDVLFITADTAVWAAVLDTRGA